MILEISSKRLGATAVLEGKSWKGSSPMATCEECLRNGNDFLGITAKEIMTQNPKTVEPDMLVVNALTLMRQNNITQLLVVDKDTYTGVIHFTIYSKRE